MKKVLLTVLIMLGATAAISQVPGTLSYQGILVQTTGPNIGQPVNDGTYNVIFRFFNVETGGSSLFTRGGVSGLAVTTYKGMFTTVIGSNIPNDGSNSPLDPTLFNGELWVELAVNGQTITPRVRLTTTPYAFRAQAANTLDAAGLTGTVPNTVLDADLQDLADGTLTGSKVGTGVPAANITGLGALATLSSVTSATITDATIATADLADGSVTLVKHADNSVNSAKIVDASIATGDLADGSVTLAKHADNSVNSAKLVDGSVATADIADDAVNTAKIGTAGAGDANKVLTTDGSGNPQWELKTSVSPLSGSGTSGNVTFWSGAGTLSSDGSFYWDNTNKRIGFGTTTPQRRLHIVGTGGNENDILIDMYGTSFGAGNLRFHRARGTSSVPTAALDGDQLGNVSFAGYTGSAYTVSAAIHAIAESDFSSSVNADLTFLTALNGTNSEKMRITSAGRVGIGTTSPGSRLHVAGADWSVNPLLLSASAATAGSSIRFTSPDAGNRTYDIIGSTGTGASMGAGFFGIWDDTGGAYRFVINPSGYIGINNITPASQLAINSSVPVRSLGIDHDYAGSSTQYGITVDMTGGTGTGAKYGIDCNVTGTSASTSALYGLETDLNPNGGTGTMYGVNSSVLASGASGSRYGVYSIVGTAAGTSSGISVYGQITGSATGTHYGVYGYADGAGTNYGVYGFAPSAEAGYAVYASGNMAYTGTITDVSDQRLKMNIQPMPGVLKKVLELRPTTFFYKAKEYSFMQLPEEKQLGLIAQEVEEVFPEVVTDNVHPGVTDADGKAIHMPVEYKGIDYTILVPVLIKAMQEQQAIIDNQNSGIKELKAELAELRKMVMAMQSGNTAEKISASAGNEK
jgi:hypothetical protein